jgi:hypothetical protein
MSTPLLRPIALTAAAGGVGWIAFAVFTVASGPAEDTRVVLTDVADYAGFTLFAVCLALAVACPLALHLHHRGADGALGRTGARVAMAGAGAQCVVIAGIVVNGEETSWFGIAAPLAILTWFAGSVMLGVAVRRVRLLPAWVGIGLPIATLLAIVGANAGTSVLLGAFQLVIGLRIAGASSAGASRPLVAST